MFLIMGHTDEKSENEKSEMELLREGLLNDDIETDKNIMKDMKTFLTENGRYQAFGRMDEIYLIDTRTGKMWEWDWEVPNYNYTMKWFPVKSDFKE